MLARGGQEDGSHQDFRTRGVESKMIFELRYKVVIHTVYIVLRYYCGGHTQSSVLQSLTVELSRTILSNENT